MMNNKTVKKGLLPYIFIFCFMIICLLMFNKFNTTVNELTYDEFIKELESKEVTEINIIPKISSDTYEVTGKLKDYEETETFILTLPKSDEFISKITERADNGDFKLEIEEDPNSAEWIGLIIEIVPLLLLVGATFWLFTRQIGGNNKSMDFGKSRAKLLEEGT